MDLNYNENRFTSSISDKVTGEFVNEEPILHIPFAQMSR